MMSENFNTKSFWGDRLKGNFNLKGVGYASLGLPFNTWMYRLRARMVSHVIPRTPIGQQVLDVGSGTGFYISLWKRFGRNVDGIDIAPVVIEHLRRQYPSSRFTLGSISSSSPPDLGQYDVVSAFDVLFHIVDDREYEQALKNIHSLLKSGGYFFHSDNLPSKRLSFQHQVSRSFDEVKAALARNGLVIRETRPMFFLMNAPIASESKVLRVYWRIVVAALSRLPSAGYVIGPILYILDSCLLSLVKDGPSTKLIIAQKV